MIVQLSAKVSLFLYVRTHSQVAYYLNLADSTRAANDSGAPVPLTEGDNGPGPNVVGLRDTRSRSRA